MASHHASAIAGIVTALFAATGCSPVTNVGNSAQAQQSDVSTAINTVLTEFEDSADLSGDSANATSFLESAQDDSSGTGISAQALRGVQDVTGNLSAQYAWPTPQSSTSFVLAAPDPSNRPYWLYELVTNSADHSPTATVVSRNKRWTLSTTYYVSQGTKTYLPPFGSEQIVVATSDGKVHEDEIVSPEATATIATAATPSIPAIFATSGLIPSMALIRSATLTFPAFGYTDGDLNTAVGGRWVAYDQSVEPTAGTYYPISAWMRALKVSRVDASGSFTVYRYDIATNYHTLVNAQQHTVKAPLEFITDDYNAAKGTEWHDDRAYDPSTNTWIGNGYFVPEGGATHSIATTWAAGATSGPDVWTRTASWTDPKGNTIGYMLDYNFDQSGTGSVSVDGLTVATLTWAPDLKGTATLTSGQTRTYRVPRP